MRCGNRSTAFALVLVLTTIMTIAACSDSGVDDGGSADSDAASESERSTTDETTSTVAAPDPYPGYTSQVYGDATKWLCRPDTDDGCDGDMDATVIRSDGSTSTERWKPATDPPIDCFYVYPTISTDPGTNSDFDAGDDQERMVVRQQAARLGSTCRVFAPIYRQITLTSLTNRLAGNATAPPEPGVSAYGDVVDAWKHYMTHDNNGRGVVLIGHSQGSGHLNQLIRSEIDPRPELVDRLVSAFLPGSSVAVPDGQDVGGDFQHVPLCRRTDETGCVLSWASFRATAPPPANSFFGQVRAGGSNRAACTNPAKLEGGPAPAQPYFPTNQMSLPGGMSQPPTKWIPSSDAVIPTPFVSLPDFVTVECVRNGPFDYLSVSPASDPLDQRAADVRGDLSPEWGLHLIDVNLVMGDIVDLVGQQSEAFTRRG